MMKSLTRDDCFLRPGVPPFPSYLCGILFCDVAKGDDVLLLGAEAFTSVVANCDAAMPSMSEPLK